MTELSEDQKAKAVWRFKNELDGVLEIYNCYGMGAYEIKRGVKEEITELALQLSKRFRGKDVPIDHSIAVQKLRTRKK